MTCTMEVLDSSGHLTLEWDPNDQASVARAQAEWEKLKAAGFAFFAEGTEAESIEAGRIRGSVEARIVQVEPEAVQPKRRRGRPRKTVAVPPLRGG
jgi:hypothetical protein